MHNVTKFVTLCWQYCVSDVLSQGNQWRHCQMLNTFSGYLYVIVWCPAFGLFNIEVSFFRVYSRNNWFMGLCIADFKV